MPVITEYYDDFWTLLTEVQGRACGTQHEAFVARIARGYERRGDDMVIQLSDRERIDRILDTCEAKNGAQ